MADSVQKMWESVSTSEDRVIHQSKPPVFEITEGINRLPREVAGFEYIVVEGDQLVHYVVRISRRQVTR